MKSERNYHADDSMSDLIENQYRMLLVLSRFGIGLGFGDRTVGEVCALYGVDPWTFLAVVNTTLNGNYGDLDRISVDALLAYLSRTHEYYLKYRIPSMRRELVKVWAHPENDLFRAMMRYYDDFADDLSRHARREEKELFPYIRSLVAGVTTTPPRAETFVYKHDRIKTRLDELKRVLIKYYPADDTNRMNDILFNLQDCEYDLASHSAVEDTILRPLVAELERKLKPAPDIELKSAPDLKPAPERKTEPATRL